ncbi:MAG: hypothetical protein IKV57_09300 [Clostridia bacterium]|nr:hypothetical protein [Clostridia bacterium]
MRKFLWILAGFCLLITGCGKTPEADPNRLTHVYAPIVESRNEWLMSSSGIWTAGDGYGYVYTYDNMKSGEAWEHGIHMVLTDSTGEILSDEPMEFTRSIHNFAVGDDGVYFFYLSSEKDVGYVLHRVGWDGSMTLSPTGEWKPGSASSTIPESLITANPDLPLTETEDGIAVVWGKRCVLLDEDLQPTGEIELPGQGDMVFAEDDILWITYKTKEGRALGKAEDGVLTEICALPERLQDPNQFNWKPVIACEDGWLYGWDSAGVFRWQFTADAEEPVYEDILSFQNSTIPAAKVRTVRRIPGKTPLYSVQYGKGNGYFETAALYEPAPDLDLSQITVLNLVCAGQSYDLAEIVIGFNRTHRDARIQIIEYDDYQKMQMELDNGLVKADLLYGVTWNPMDLLPLMTGEVKPEDIAPCVMNQFAPDGKLYEISPNITFSTLYGRQDTVASLAGWTLEEFLDYAESLPEGEYLIEDVGQTYSYFALFDGKAYEPFIRDGKAYFTDPLYPRYLKWLSTVPVEGQKYMDHGSSNVGSLLAGEITADQVVVESGGENLYFNGKIKLSSGTFTSLQRMMRLYHTFGTDEIAFIGYPTQSGKGISVGWSGIYCIPQTCQDPVLAWELIESLLLAATELPEVDHQLGDLSFPTLAEPYYDYLESMRGWQSFQSYDGSTRTNGWNLELDENGTHFGLPGAIYEVNDTVIGNLRWLYENAGSPGGYDWEIRDIAYEEESRFLAGAISAEECADIVQSRVGIYLAEHE